VSYYRFHLQVTPVQ